MKRTGVRWSYASALIFASAACLLAVGCSKAPHRTSAGLISAARAIGFRPTLEAGIGQVEDLPANAVSPGEDSYLLPVGSRAPSFRLETPVGKVVDLTQLRGKAVLIEFYATWCPHCQAETPHLVRLSKSLAPSRYAIIAVNGDGETAPSLYAFDRFFHVPYPTLLDPSDRAGSFHTPGSPGRTTREYGVRFFPTFYVVAPGGRIAWRGDKELPDALLLRELRGAFGAR